MTDLERAMADVAFIQQRLAASTRFDGLAPQAVLGTGLLALVAAAAQRAWPAATADARGFALFWSGVAGAAVLLIGGEAIGRSRRRHGSMADTLIASTLRLLLPFLAAGAGVTLVLLRVAPDSGWMLPGLWQVLIALAGFSAVSVLPRAIVWPAAWYLASGLAVLALAAGGGVPDPWLMGIPFAIGQTATALVLHLATGGDRG